MAKTAKKKRGRPANPKKENPTAALTPFVIEINPPKPNRPTSQELLGVLTKVDELVTKMKEGQAFIVPKRHKGSIRKHLNTYEAFKFVMHRVAGNDSVLRIYKYEYKKQK